MHYALDAHRTCKVNPRVHIDMLGRAGCTGRACGIATLLQTLACPALQHRRWQRMFAILSLDQASCIPTVAAALFSNHCAVG